MNEAFFALEPEKRERILDAAYDEFAKEGYKEASTNRITKEAGISKGVLFYYFGSKQALYQYLADLSMRAVYEGYLCHIGEDSGDFIRRYAHMGEMKRRAIRELPHAFAFFSSLYLRAAPEALTPQMNARLGRVREDGLNRLYENLDMSLFRPDLRPERVIKMIRYCMDGYESELMRELADWDGSLENDDFQKWWDRFYMYLDELRTVFYDRGGKP